MIGSRMMIGNRIRLLPLILLAASIPSVAWGQDTSPPDTTELVFSREVFTYPSYERRNPFTPLISGDVAGPRFEELSLLGIVYFTNPELSVALFGSGNRGGAGPTGSAAESGTHRAHIGDVVGNMRVIEIQRTKVIVEVEDFGLTEQRVMELPRLGRGGS